MAPGKFETVSDSQCDINKKPKGLEEQDCNMIACAADWVPTKWSKVWQIGSFHLFINDVILKLEKKSCFSSGYLIRVILKNLYIPKCIFMVATLNFNWLWDILLFLH